jgi:hypothetical protein
MDHNKEIAAAAKAVLAPLGCIRKGRSRTWLDDHGWWAGLVEFQPSGWSRGSYLNVAVCYLWKPTYPEPSLSFDAVLDPRPWREVKEGESFAGAAAELASIARDSLIKLREDNRSVAVAAKWLQNMKIEGRVWQDYHLGIAYGLSGQIAAAQRHLRLAVESLPNSEWPLFRDECSRYLTLVEKGSDFRSAILERIRSTRATLKLTPAPWVNRGFAAYAEPRHCVGADDMS